MMTLHSIGLPGTLGEIARPRPRYNSEPLTAVLLQRGLQGLNLSARLVIGSGLAWLIHWLLPVILPLNFFAALSAGLVLLYLANLADVQRLRDGLFCVLPGLLVWIILAYAPDQAAAVALTLFIHLMLAFFAATAGISGGLRELQLWPVLFGFNLMVLAGVAQAYL
ncbi:MAG: hypothetical protein SV765_10700 [Pseudomonadota bacterium]|nr:hypothetical protein [Pseudomonadota bacterium]